MRTAVSLLLVALTATAFGQKDDKIRKQAIFVADFKNTTSFRGLEKSITDTMTTLVAQTRRFDIVERSALGDLLKEQELALTGLVDPARAAQAGKLIGADMILVGAINSATFETKTRVTVNPKTKQKTTKTYYRAAVTINGRLVDVETGSVAYSETGTAAVEQDQPNRQAMIEQAAQQAARNLIVTMMERIPYMGYLVVKQEDGNYMVTLARNNGLKARCNLEVIREKPPVTNPVTGEPIRQPPEVIGYMWIRTIGEETSSAKFIKGNESQVQPGMKVRVIKPIFRPGYAVSSVLVPGLGQVLAKKYMVGAAWLVVIGGGAGASYWLFTQTDEEAIRTKYPSLLDDESGTQVDSIKTTGMMIFGIAAGVTGLLHIAQVVTAGYPAQRNPAFDSRASLTFDIGLEPGPDRLAVAARMRF